MPIILAGEFILDIFLFGEVDEFIPSGVTFLLDFRFETNSMYLGVV